MAAVAGLADPDHVPAGSDGLDFLDLYPDAVLEPAEYSFDIADPVAQLGLEGADLARDIGGDLWGLVDCVLLGHFHRSLCRHS